MEGVVMNRDWNMKVRFRCAEILNNPNSTESERISAELALKHLPPITEGFAALSQPEEK
jgi:hypothetical protein